MATKKAADVSALANEIAALRAGTEVRLSKIESAVNPPAAAQREAPSMFQHRRADGVWTTTAWYVFDPAWYVFDPKPVAPKPSAIERIEASLADFRDGSRYTGRRIEESLAAIRAAVEKPRVPTWPNFVAGLALGSIVTLFATLAYVAQ